MDNDLRARLLALARDDQRARRSRESFRDTDATNAEALRGIIASGWPTFRKVGKEAAIAAWLIAQHADHNVRFQRRCLSLMSQAARHRQADPMLVAYLMDRVLVNGGKAQRFGTQFYVDRNGRFGPRPIAGRASLEARRKKLGMEPFHEYQARMVATQDRLRKAQKKTGPASSRS